MVPLGAVLRLYSRSIQMQVQVRINEEGALRNQRYAFTDKVTLISELMQNAQRAGARRSMVEVIPAPAAHSSPDKGRP